MAVKHVKEGTDSSSIYSRSSAACSRCNVLYVRETRDAISALCARDRSCTAFRVGGVPPFGCVLLRVWREVLSFMAFLIRTKSIKMDDELPHSPSLTATIHAARSSLIPVLRARQSYNKECRAAALATGVSKPNCPTARYHEETTAAPPSCSTTAMDPASSKPKLSINTEDAKSSAALLAMLASERGWPEVRANKGHIMWVVSPEALEKAMLARRGEQRISHIPGMHCLCRKVTFAHLARAHDFGTFFPETFIVQPGEQPTKRCLAALKNESCLILKPNDGTQGDGIHIIRTASDLKRRLELSKETVVLQRYISSPWLLQPSNLKFDLRIYGLILSVRPLRIFLCRDGLVRVCSEPYTPPDQEATGTRCSKHLTNYSAQKYEPGFEHNDDPKEAHKGTKRSLAPLMSYLEQQYARGGAGSGAGSGAGAIWEQIRGLCSKTLGAMAAQLDGGPALPVDAIGLGPEELWSPSRKGVSVWDNVQTRWDDPGWGAWRSKCFHLLGIDVILSADGRAHLLEVNCNPSLGIDAVHVTEGPHATQPQPPHPGTEELIVAAMPLMKGRGVKVCRCRSHHRPHLHRPCPIDMTAKRSCVGGALTIVERDLRAAREGREPPSPSALSEGTRYEPLGANELPEKAQLQPIVTGEADSERRSGASADRWDDSA